MPILYANTLSNGTRIGVWHAIEGDDFFLDSLTLFPQEIEEISLLNARKKSEWLCSRYLLHDLSGHNDMLATLKNHYGKPYLPDTQWQISLSHSGPYTAAVLSEHETGIDIQVMLPKIERIKTKFLSARELAQWETSGDLQHLHVYGGAKEYLFKAYGKGHVDFKKDLFVAPFEYASGTCLGTVDKTDYYSEFQIDHQEIRDAMLVFISDQLVKTKPL
ncbi:MAG: hypothetical protein IPN29_06180 [Saprospiraceae bacterium]|nr:hypothetical protein [Saprospiraceae bacterium]